MAEIKALETRRAIRAALCGKWFNCLITDGWIAGELMHD